MRINKPLILLIGLAALAAVTLRCSHADVSSAMISVDATQEEQCGNGIIEGREQCDDGSDFNSDTEPDRCRTNCRLPRCGDGTVDADEVCDPGYYDSPTCNSLTCSLSECGDGYLNLASMEECEVGPTDDLGQEVDPYRNTACVGCIRPALSYRAPLGGRFDLHMATPSSVALVAHAADGEGRGTLKLEHISATGEILQTVSIPNVIEGGWKSTIGNDGRVYLAYVQQLVQDGLHLSWLQTWKAGYGLSAKKAAGGRVQKAAFSVAADGAAILSYPSGADGQYLRIQTFNTDISVRHTVEYAPCITGAVTVLDSGITEYQGIRSVLFQCADDPEALQVMTVNSMGSVEWEATIREPGFHSGMLSLVGDRAVVFRETRAHPDVFETRLYVHRFEAGGVALPPVFLGASASPPGAAQTNGRWGRLAGGSGSLVHLVRNLAPSNQSLRIVSQTYTFSDWAEASRPRRVNTGPFMETTTEPVTAFLEPGQIGQLFWWISNAQDGHTIWIKAYKRGRVSIPAP